ncbi:MAG TPA: hypothetical protein VLE97_09570 [Gaiellaceae bacterium]|nr:hypothetical protein [Gaiellaceae bacterium]
MSCRHRNVVVVGSHETGASSAHCSDCKTPLSRRIEGGDYVYVTRDAQDNVEVVFGQNPRSGKPAPLPVATARLRKP